MTTTSVEHPVGRPTERTGGSGSVGPRRRERRLGDYVFLVPAVGFVVLTVLYPVGYNIVQSFQDVGLAQIVGGGAEFVGLDNYRDQFGRSAFWDSLAISLVYTVGTVALTFVTGLLLALLFNRVFPGRNVMRSLLLMAWILPTVVSANVWRWLLDGTYGLVSTVLSGVGLIDSDTFLLAQPRTAVISVVFATAWTFAPFAMILLLAGLQGVPSSLYEAARIDGAGPLRQFREITLPILRPVSITTALLCFIYTFKTFDTVYLMTGGGPGGSTKILPIYSYEQAFDFFRFGTAAVGTTVLLAVPLLLSIVYFWALRKEERS